ncbi:MAG: hypothetical protein V2I54_13785 [Bacteroidales bacterium]|nr:hypothetical protein [Bacteroidales bacterium]
MRINYKRIYRVLIKSLFTYCFLLCTLSLSAQRGDNTEYSIIPRFGISPSSGGVGIEIKQAAYSASVGYQGRAFPDKMRFAAGISRYWFNSEKRTDMYTTVYFNNRIDESGAIGLIIGVRLAKNNFPLDLKIGLGYGSSWNGQNFYFTPEAILGIPIKYSD